MLLIIGLVLFGVCGYTQDYIKLSKQNGFDNYKFGAAPSAYDNLQFRKTDGQNGDTYDYTGPSKKPYGGYLASIKVEFYKKKLQEIGLYYQFQSDREYKVMLKELETIFGSSNDLIIKIPNTMLARYWEDGQDYKVFINHYENHVVSIRFQCWSDSIFD